MDDKHLHSNELMENSRVFFEKGQISFEKSGNEVWNELENKLSEKPAAQTVSLSASILKWSAAAAFALLTGLTMIVFLYSKTLVSVPGQQFTAALPDGSTIHLNAGSTVKYHPLKWKFNRTIQFEGEGFFEVTKGKKFKVVSVNGTTQVLGTSFNVYSRDDKYRVTCLTGKVKVFTNENESVLLTPNNQVELENGKLVMKNNYNREKAIGWKLNRFDFTERPLGEVFSEIERQFAIKVQLNRELQNRIFTGNFPKPENVEEVLNNICKPMQLEYVKQSENVFLIVKMN